MWFETWNNFPVRPSSRGTFGGRILTCFFFSVSLFFIVLPKLPERGREGTFLSQAPCPGGGVRATPIPPSLTFPEGRRAFRLGRGGGPLPVQPYSSLRWGSKHWCSFPVSSRWGQGDNPGENTLSWAAWGKTWGRACEGVSGSPLGCEANCPRWYISVDTDVVFDICLSFPSIYLLIGSEP